MDYYPGVKTKTILGINLCWKTRKMSTKLSRKTELIILEKLKKHGNN